MGIKEPNSKVADSNTIKRRVLLFLLTLTLATLLAAPTAMAQETPFDSQYAPPTGPPPTTECVEDGSSDGSSDGSGTAEDCEDLEVLPVTGGLATVPFSVLAPAALLGAGIVVATGIVAIRR